MRNIWNVAIDVLREAAASKYLIVLFGFICLCVVAMAFALDLEVVNGAIAAGKVFGSSVVRPGESMAAKDFLAPLMQGVVYASCLGGLLFLIVAVADIAPKLLAPGRVELLLALPLRRTELVLGIYLGVIVIGALAASLAIGGASLVLFAKLELFTVAPVLGAAAALVGFATVYGVMLAVSTVGRSAALSAGAAILVFLAGVATSDRQAVLALIRHGTTREIAAVVMGPLPRLATLAEIGGQVANQTAVAWGQAAAVTGGCAAFGFFFVMAACIVVNVRDY
jgi:Cu-processing system permease protein